jgi:hypothetical protein
VYGRIKTVNEHLIDIGILRIFAIIGIFIASCYIFIERQKWHRFSQGLKPAFYGILLFLSILLFNFISANQINVETLFNLLTLNDFIVGFSRLVILSYILILVGIEISIIILIKRLKK